jgi:flagellar basal-body rod modification protein FlgD
MAATDDLLFGSVENGKYTGPTTDTSQTTSTKTSNDELGKQEFLQLLVAQMQYQDPLEPTSNTEYISQLATFSQVEQLENLNTAYSNTQAFSLVGKTVTIASTNSVTGSVSTTEGVVDYVTMESGKAYLSIDGSLYDADDLSTIKSDDYAYEENKPSVSKGAWTYNGKSPSDVSVAIDFGTGASEASSVALLIGSDYVVNGSSLSYENGKLTVSGDALSGLENGTYPVTFVFDDSRSTNVSDQVTLTVFNSTAGTETDDTEETETTAGTDTTETTENTAAAETTTETAENIVAS